MFCIGPDLVSCNENRGPIDGIKFTGKAMEFATAEDHVLVPIYRRINDFAPERFEIDDLVFHEEHLILDIKFWDFMAVRTPVGDFLPFGSLVCALYAATGATRDITDFFTDLYTTLGINHSHEGPNRIQRPGLTSPSLLSMGFEVTDMMSYGKRVFVTLAWKRPADAGNSVPSPIDFYEHAANLAYRPTPDRKLRAAKWEAADGRKLADLLYEKARAHCAANPMNVLSAEGMRAVLDAFEWTPVAQMTRPQAHAARIDFIRKNQLLADEPKKLAVALKQAGLYSKGTAESSIVKNLPKLIAAALLEN